MRRSVKRLISGRLASCMLSRPWGGSKAQPRRARFSAQADPQDYLFKARPESPHGFSCGTAKLLNRTFVLPVGAVLYDPDSWNEEKQEYTRVSEPAQ